MSDEETTDSSSEEGNQLFPDWEIREEWLENIFTHYEGEPVTIWKFEVYPEYGNNEGTLSSVTTVYGKYCTEKHQVKTTFSIVIKQLPKDPFSRFFVTEGKFDLREIKFYTQVIADLKNFRDKQIKQSRNIKIPLPVPRCYYAHYTPIGGTEDSPVPPESILVLQDLRVKGYTSAEFSVGLSIHNTQLALDAIARIHGLSLSMKVLDGVCFSERYQYLFATEQASMAYQQLVERGLPQLAHFLESKPGMETILETLMDLRPRTKDILSSLLAPEGPLALLTHTDFWCNNLFFSLESNSECYILDWQMLSYSRPTNDIALLIVSSLPTDLRREHTELLLDTYWNKLTWTCSHLGLNITKDLGYTREDLSKDYRKSQMLALLLCIGSVDIALGDPVTEQRLIDVLEDLYKDGILTDETIIAKNEADS